MAYADLVVLTHTQCRFCAPGSPDSGLPTLGCVELVRCFRLSLGVQMFLFETYHQMVLLTPAHTERFMP